MLMKQGTEQFCEVWLGNRWFMGSTSHVSVDGCWWEGYDPTLSGIQLIKPPQTRNPTSLFLLVLHLNGPETEVDTGMLVRQKWE